MQCFECGAEGHYGRDCPNKSWIASDSAADGRPRWCGACDERSRHIGLADGRVKRCHCHPNSHEQLKQHRKCPACRKTVVIWDASADCQHHILAGVPRHRIGPPAARPAPSRQAEAARQAAESRAGRAISITGNFPPPPETFPGNFPAP